MSHNILPCSVRLPMTYLTVALLLSPVRAAAPAGSSAGAALQSDSTVPDKATGGGSPFGKLPNITASLDSVEWAGPGVSLDDLRGKTTVVMPFVTWCPKCNAWAPEMLDQISKAIKDKPVVVVAVATDVDAAQGKSFH